MPARRHSIPAAAIPGSDDGTDFPLVWFWRARLPERKGQPCRVVARGALNSIKVEFPDGYVVITSRYAVRAGRAR